MIKNNLGIVLLCIAWIIVTVSNLRIYWMLVDDGDDVIFARTLFEKIHSLNFMGFASQLFETNGRFRPVYWLYQMIVWLIGGNSYQFQHFAHMLVICITILFIYLAIKELTHSKIASFFAALFYLLTPLNAENIFRLGPQEPLLVMFISILVYLIIRNQKIFLPCLMIILAVFTKETSLALLPVLFFNFIYGKRNKFIKNKKQGFYLWVTICISSAMLILITFLRRGGYSTNYYFNIPALTENFVAYLKELDKNFLYIFPLIPIVYLIRTGIALIKRQNIFGNKQNLFEFLFFIGFFGLFFIQLPWKYEIARYLMPAVFFLILFSFVEIYEDLKLLCKLKFINNHKQVFIFLLAFFGVYAFSIWGLEIISEEISYTSYYDAFKQMASYPKNTILLMNMQKVENTVELVDETQIQLSEFWKRSDIKVEYLDLQNLPKVNYVIVDSSQFLRDYSQNNLNLLFKNKHTSIEKTSRTLVASTPVEIIKQTFKKLISLLIYKKKFTPDGIYTYYYNYNNWYFYNE